jgi:hypothetical protein
MEEKFTIVTSEHRLKTVVVDLDLLIEQLITLSRVIVNIDEPEIEELEGARNLLELFIDVSGKEMREKLNTAYENIGT